VNATIAVIVNGERRLVGPDTSVADLVAVLDAGPRGIAVARNEGVVPRSAWAATIVTAEDRIEILDAAQGG
jgi:sulfur carrier protein